MLEEIKKSLKSSNVNLVLSAFLNEKQQPIPRKLRDIRKKFMEKYKKTKYTKEFDTPIDRALKGLKKVNIVEEDKKILTINKNYFNIIRKANDVELLKIHNEVNITFLPNMSLYGINKKLIGKPEIKVLQLIGRNIQKEIKRLELIQTKLRLEKIQGRYKKKLKGIKDKKLKSLLKKYSRGILKDSPRYNLSDSSLKKSIIQQRFFKKRGDTFYSVSISKEEKEKIADFCIELRKDIWREFPPSNIVLMYKTHKRNFVKDLMPVLSPMKHPKTTKPRDYSLKNPESA